MHLLKNYLYKGNKKRLFEGVSAHSKKLMLIQGIGGSGKSTFIKPLESKQNVFVYNVDTFTENAIKSDRRLINAGITVSNAFSKKQPGNIQSILDNIRKDSVYETEKLQKQAFREGKHIIIEGTGGRFYSETVTSYQAAGYEVMYLSIYAPLEYCIDSNWLRGICGGRTLSEYIISDSYNSYNRAMSKNIIGNFKNVGVFCEVVSSLYKIDNFLYYPWYATNLMPNNYCDVEMSEGMTKNDFKSISREDVIKMKADYTLANKIKKIDISRLSEDSLAISKLSNKTISKINAEIAALIN